MARIGRPTVEVVLTDDERETLRRWSRRATLAQALALRCRIVLACADGLSNTQVGADLGIHPTTETQMHYRNRIVYAASAVLILSMIATAVYFLFLDSGVPSNAWDVVLALAVPCASAWVFIRAGLTPYVQWGEGQLTICNPFVVYSAPLSDVRLLGRSEKGGAFDIAGIGQVTPWSLTRSVFDGKRANDARHELRHAVLRAQETEDGANPSVTRRLRVGWLDVLLFPFIAACIWAFIPS